MRLRSSIDGDGLRCSRTDLMTNASTAVAGTLWTAFDRQSEADDDPSTMAPFAINPIA